MTSMMEALKKLSFLPDIHAVGGAVRDMLLGRGSKDLDFATSATPMEVKRLAAEHGYGTVLVGESFGTVVLLDGDEQYDVSTFRSSSNRLAGYSTRIEDDLKTRDFTMNAMAMNPDGNIIDPYGGREDIERTQIRCVGVPIDRYREDPLRIVRAIRFASTLEFILDRFTWYAADMMTRDVIDGVSVERIVMEMNKAFAGPQPDRFMRMLFNLGKPLGYSLGGMLLPEFGDMIGLKQNPKWHPEGDVWRHTSDVLARSSPELRDGWPVHRWHALFHDLGKVYAAQEAEDGPWFTFYNHERLGMDPAREVMERLRFPNTLRRSVLACIRWHMRPMNLTDSMKHRRRFQAEVGEYLDDLSMLCKADSPDRWEETQRLFIPAPNVDPVVSGKDLIAHGLTPGPSFGPIIKISHNIQLEEELFDKDTLIRRAVHEWGNQPS